MKTEISVLEENQLKELSRTKIIRDLSRKLNELDSLDSILRTLYLKLKTLYSFTFLILSNPNKRPGLVIYPTKIIFSSKDLSDFVNELKSQKIDSEVTYHLYSQTNESPLSFGGKYIQEMVITKIDSQFTPHCFFGMISFEEPIGIEKSDIDFFQIITNLLTLKYANIELNQSVDKAKAQIIDDSQRIQRENDQRSELLKKIKSQTQELRIKSQEVEEFVYSVSHDLKTPVISILGFIETLKSDSDNDFSSESIFYLERIEKNTRHVISMIDEVLEYSRIGRFTQERTKVNLTTIINESLLRFSKKIDTRKVKIELDSDFPDVEVEFNRLLQLFDNLIGNSIKFMGEQENPVIKIGTSAYDTDYTRVFISDNGIGIPEASHKKVFNLFTRASNVNDDIEGSGIGLAQVKKIVEIHEGNIWLESKEGEGTTILFTLPLAT